MSETTINLKRMEEIQSYLRLQMSGDEEFVEFAKTVENTMNGWVNSNC